MNVLSVHKDFQNVRKLTFCYLCGRDFGADDVVDGDHVPPSCVFNARDRVNVLKLTTHRKCNGAFSVEDKKAGQLIALRRRENTSSARDDALKFGHYPGLGVALENLNVDAAIWRWIKGFHAALYRQPLVGDEYSIQTPFPRADKNNGLVTVRPIRQQHLLTVESIKRNRASGNLDAIIANNGKLRFECVWCLADDQVSWFCMFALDIYDWKDLGSHSNAIPARGCAGVYLLPDKTAPEGAATGRDGPVLIPNVDVLDAFAS